MKKHNIDYWSGFGTLHPDTAVAIYEGLKFIARGHSAYRKLVTRLHLEGAEGSFNVISKDMYGNRYVVARGPIRNYATYESGELRWNETAPEEIVPGVTAGPQELKEIYDKSAKVMVPKPKNPMRGLCIRCRRKHGKSPQARRCWKCRLAHDSERKRIKKQEHVT